MIRSFSAPSTIVPAPFDKEPMFEYAWDEDCPIQYEGAVHTVKVRFSVATKEDR